MIEFQTYKDFETAFVETEDYTDLSSLLTPMLRNFKFKNRRHDSWGKLFKKFDKILKNIYKTNFENGFQHKRLSIEEVNIVENIFRFMQRIIIYTNNIITLPSFELFLPYALCFEPRICIQALKVVSLYYYKDKVFEGNSTHIEILLKLINLPEVKVKKSLFDKEVVINRTNSTIVEDPFEYFNNNKNDKNISDLYLETHEILCTEEESFFIKNYPLLIIGKLIDQADAYLQNIKSRITDDNDEMIYLFDDFVFYLIHSRFDKMKIKEIFFTGGFLECRLKYNEYSSFENILIFSNLKELNLDIKFPLTSQTRNPDLDFEYYAAILHLIEKDTDRFPKCIDVEEFKSLLDTFDIIHAKKDNFTLKIIFKIMNETYKKNSAYFEPFEYSKYLKKCIKLIKERSVEFSYLCCTTIIYFIYNDPLSIPEIANQGILEFFYATFDDYEVNFAFLNLLDNLSLNTELRDKIVNGNIIGRILDGALISNDFNTINYAKKYNTLLTHYPEYKAETIKYIKKRFRSKIITTGFLRFCSSLDLSNFDFNTLESDDLLSSITFIVKNNCHNDVLWKDAFIKCLKTEFFSNFDQKVILIDQFIILFMRNIDLDNVDLIEIYLYIICDLIHHSKEGFYDTQSFKFSPLFNILLEIIYIITDHLTDRTVVNFFDLKEKNNLNIYDLVWMEVNYILNFIWSIEDFKSNGNIINDFLNLFVNQQNVCHKRTKSNISIFEHTRSCLYNILIYNVGNWKNNNLSRLMDWLCLHYTIFSISEICEILDKIVVHNFQIKIEHFNWITKLLHENNSVSNLFRFYDHFLAQIYSTNNESNTFQHKYFENNIHIANIYDKYYTHNFDIKYKYILNYQIIYDKVIEDLNFKVFYDKPDFGIEIIQTDFYDKEDFINLCIYTFKYATFNNIFLDVPSRLKIIIKSKACNFKLKMKYILTYIKYMKSQRREISEINKIIKFILRFVKKKNLLIYIKFIISQIFDYSDNLINFKARSPFDFIHKNFIVCYNNIYLFRENFKHFLDENKKIFKPGVTYYDTKILFKFIMKSSLTNTDILPILTEIVFNNTTHMCLINERFIRKLFKKYIDHADINVHSKGYINALKFVSLCLKFKDVKVLSMVYKIIIRKMRKCVNYRIYNYILILYNSIDSLDVILSNNETGLNPKDFTLNSSSFYITSKIEDEIFSILAKINESDLHIQNVKNTIGIQKWDDLQDKNRASFIFHFILMLYDPNYEMFLDTPERNENEIEELSEIITPECSSTSETISSREEDDCLEKRKWYKELCYSYFLCEEEFEILEESDSIKFIELVTDLLKKEYNIKEEMKNKDSDEPKDNLDDNIKDSIGPPEENLADYKNESSIGRKEGIFPTTSVDDINQMDEVELDKFIRHWYFFRKQTYKFYIEIDINFINKLNEGPRNKFIDCEKMLIDDYRFDAIMRDLYTEREQELFKGLDLFLSPCVFKIFFDSFVTSNWSINNDVLQMFESYSYDRIIKFDMLQVLNDRLTSSSGKELVTKCIRILDKIYFSCLQYLGTYENLIKNLLEIAYDRNHTRSILFILSKVYIHEEFEKDLLNSIAMLTNLNLSSQSRNYLIEFCKKNINNYLIDLMTILLDNTEKSLFVLVELSLEYLENRKSNSFTTDTNFNNTLTTNLREDDDKNFKNFIEKLYFVLDENLANYTNLTLFGLFEEFVYSYKLNNLEIKEKYINKRKKLELCINDKKEEINNFPFTNDFIIRFLLKFNISNFTKKKNHFYNKLDYFNEEPFIITVNRKSLLFDSMFNIMRKSPIELKARRIQIKFAGEKGLDYGGLTKEWLELLIKDALNPNRGLFVYSSDKNDIMIPYMHSNINPDHILFFKFIGRILSIIIIDSHNVGINFAKSIYKYLLNKKCTIEDLEEIDPQYYKSLIWIQNNKIDNVLNLTFIVESDDFGIYKIIELIPNGKNIKVTDENKSEYINLILNYKLVKSIEEQLKAIKKGLFDMIDEDLINLFNENELELLIWGIPDINVDDWRNNTEYKGYTNKSRIIIWFWKAVEGFTSDEKALLLQFCTGSSRVPYGGFKNLKSINGVQNFSIHKITTKRLPNAHTCFNQLDLPEYETYEDLRKKLIYAINECQGGFHLI